MIKLRFQYYSFKLSMYSILAGITLLLYYPLNAKRRYPRYHEPSEVVSIFLET